MSNCQEGMKKRLAFSLSLKTFIHVTRHGMNITEVTTTKTLIKSDLKAIVNFIKQDLLKSPPSHK
jgi:hypothetical protein